MTIHAFVFLSMHAHFLLSPSSAEQLAKFMQFVNANVAKEAGPGGRCQCLSPKRGFSRPILADNQR